MTTTTERAPRPMYMPNLTSPPTQPAMPFSVLYTRVQHFYARQMQLLDAGDTSAWAATFSEDGIFDAGGLPEPVRGRHHIEIAASHVADQFTATGTTRRHWIGMLTFEPAPTSPTVLYVRCYALVLEIPPGGEVVARRSTVCNDVLVADGSCWLVQHRIVTRDGLD